jgi:hypothetical protein
VKICTESSFERNFPATGEAEILQTYLRQLALAHSLMFSIIIRKENVVMNLANCIRPLAAFALSVISLAACVPMDRVARPTLDEVRSGNARGQVAEDTRLRPGEIQGAIDRIDRGRREIHVVADDGRRQVLPYDVNRTHVVYHGWDYAVDNLEAGDRIAFASPPRDVPYIETVRVLEPVQARSGSPGGRSSSARSRVDVVEGTVESVDQRLGTFEIRPRAGRMVTVSVPYNAPAVDVDNFRGLRRGDEVKIEGEFVNPESFQLLSFLSPRSR